MKIDMKDWGEFQIQDLFKVVYGVNLELVNCVETDKNDPDAVAFVSRTESNNGVSAYVKPISGIDPQPADTITVAGGGSVLSTFLQTRKFYSGRDLYLLQPKEYIPHRAKLFLVTIIRANKYRYNYGRQANVTLPTLRLRLPTTQEGKPDWEWMESYINALHHKPLNNKAKTKQKKLNDIRWNWFKLGGEGGLFDIRKGQRLTSDDQTDGNIPYIGAISSNNGVSAHIGQKPIHNGNTISLSYDGSIGEAFYQDKPFWSSDAVNVLYLKEKYGTLTPAIGLFICSILKKEQYRYSYGRKWVLESMKNTFIKLPAKDKNCPDWEFMENYILSLEYGDHISKLSDLISKSYD